MFAETVWEFKTDRFRVALEVSPCQEDPADSFQFDEDADAVRQGDVEWFDARVVVYSGETEIGSDSLGCCAYKSVQEFFTSHRDPDPMNRNCSIMRSANGHNVSICHYFPDMVHQAIIFARLHVIAEAKRFGDLESTLRHNL